MVSREDIQRLIHHPYTGKPVLSLFLDMSVNSDNKRTYSVFLAKQRGRFSELDSERADHPVTDLGGALDRVQRWIDEEYDEANKGVAIYAELGGTWLEALQTPLPLPNRMDIADRAVIAPLAEMVESNPLYAIFVVERNGFRMIGVRCGEVVDEFEVETEPYPTPSDVQAGGYSAKDFQKRKEEELRHFFREFAKEAQEYDRRSHPDAIVLMGTEQNVSQFKQCLPEALAERVVFTTHKPAGDTAAAIVRSLDEFFAERHDQQATEAVEVLHDRVRHGHLAASGVHQTLEQLQEGKVEMLVVGRDLQRDGSQCQRCGFFLVHRDGACPYCGGELRHGVDVVEAMIRLAEEQEVPVEFVAPQALADIHGAGALLKF